MIYKFQEGGEMPAEATPQEQAPAQGAQDQLAAVAQQLLEALMQQVGDPQAVAAILQMALQMLQESAQQQAPVYQRNGGTLKRVK